MSMRNDLPSKVVTAVSTKNTATFALELPDLLNGAESTAGAASGNELNWNDLTATEKSAASLGVSPTAWKPIAFMNSAHYDTLLKTNAVDADLAKRLEAYKHVSLVGS